MEWNMPVFRIENEQGQWLTDMALNEPSWKVGDAIYRGHDSLEVIEVRHGDDRTTLVVKGHVVLSD
jgi:hypothetical protein